MSTQKILVIEDEGAIRKLLRMSIESAGFQYFEAVNASDGLAMTESHLPNLILLDIGLPDQSGLLVIKKIRKSSTIPIIILSVQDDDQTKIDALDSGADDYLSKPFSVPELMARIRNALRHSLPSSPSPTLHCGKIEMDLAAHTVKVEGQWVKLTTTEYNILNLLLKNSEKVVTQRQILKEVWGPNSVEHTQYLRVYLTQIRKKLGPNAGEQIQTETGIGYRLVSKV